MASPETSLPFEARCRADALGRLPGFASKGQPPSIHVCRGKQSGCLHGLADTAEATSRLEGPNTLPTTPNPIYVREPVVGPPDTPSLLGGTALNGQACQVRRGSGGAPGLPRGTGALHVGQCPALAAVDMDWGRYAPQNPADDGLIRGRRPHPRGAPLRRGSSPLPLPVVMHQEGIPTQRRSVVRLAGVCTRPAPSQSGEGPVR